MDTSFPPAIGMLFKYLTEQMGYVLKKKPHLPPCTLPRPLQDRVLGITESLPSLPQHPGTVLTVIMSPAFTLRLVRS